MKIHPDGTLEGTAEELAAYQSKMTDAKKLWLQKGNEARKEITIDGLPRIGQIQSGGQIYTSPRNPYVTVTFNQA